MLFRRPFVLAEHSKTSSDRMKSQKYREFRFVWCNPIQRNVHQKNQMRWQFVLVFGCCMYGVGVGATGDIKYSSNFEFSKCETMLKNCNLLSLNRILLHFAFDSHFCFGFWLAHTNTPPESSGIFRLLISHCFFLHSCIPITVIWYSLVVLSFIR